MEYYCNKCNETISEKEYQYSTKHFGKALCMGHQKQQGHQSTKPLEKSSYKQKPKPQPTPEAKRLGELLMKYGHHVEYEKYDGYKHIDIAIVKSKVNIEVDGGQHQGKTQALRDLKRTFYSWDKSYVTLRIPNSLTKDDATLKETAEYIHKFLKASRNQIEKEIRADYEEEGNPIWNDVNNFVNGMNDVINRVGKTVSSVSNVFSNALKKF